MRIFNKKRPHPLHKGRGLRVATLFNNLTLHMYQIALSLK